jgi:hypothetical protein
MIRFGCIGKQSTGALANDNRRFAPSQFFFQCLFQFIDLERIYHAQILYPDRPNQSFNIQFVGGHFGDRNAVAG